MPHYLRNPILITGCQRSGTTLVNLILDSHPEILGIDEDKFHFPNIYFYLYGPFSQVTPYVSFKLPEYAHILPFIEAMPACRVLWCIRDPFDVVWSMVKLIWSVGDVTSPWAVHPHGGWAEITRSYWALSDDQKAELSGHMAEFAARSNKFAELLNSPEKLTKVDRLDCVFIGALCWRIKNEIPLLYEARNIDFHIIRYMDLVTDPKNRIAQMLDYIGIDWHDDVLKHHLLHKGTSIGNTSNTRAIDKRSLGEGKRNLTLEEQDIIKTICGSTAERWNYTLND